MMTIMRYEKGHNDAVRARIVAAAARRLRQAGLDGVSIPALMQDAGLTHGAFYVHFKNRDALVEAAVMAAASETEAGVFGEGDLAEVSDRYLSRAHVQHPEHGCVLAALGSDGVRQPARVRAAFGVVARGFLRLTGEAAHRGRARARAAAPSDETLVRAATMIGAVILARLVADEALAERILAAARRAVAS
jgi:TetR/AcrR family transcriptional repressor of nem operon